MYCNPFDELDISICDIPECPNPAYTHCSSFKSCCKCKKEICIGHSSFIDDDVYCPRCNQYMKYSTCFYRCIVISVLILLCGMLAIGIIYGNGSNVSTTGNTTHINVKKNLTMSTTWSVSKLFKPFV